MQTPAIVASSVVCAAGVGREAFAAALAANTTALGPDTVSSPRLAAKACADDTAKHGSSVNVVDGVVDGVMSGVNGVSEGLVGGVVDSTVDRAVVGAVAGVDAVVLPASLSALDCRNHRLAWMGLQADGFAACVRRVAERVGAARVGVVVGTSTSSIGASEQAYRDRDAHGRVPERHRRPDLHHLHALGAFVQQALAVGGAPSSTGPATTVSTACSSSSKAFAVARRWLDADLVDAVVVGGVDSLCDSVVFGFASLQLVAHGPCRPFDVDRNGISLGEAAGFALLVRASGVQQASSTDAAPPRLLGIGESSDAFHMTAPQPAGLCIERAVRQALDDARLEPGDIDYLNLHGTATLKNDEVEAAMVARVFPASVHAGSTKGLTGHTLGASGIVETVACLLAFEQGARWGTPNTRTFDAACGPQLRREVVRKPTRRAMSNAFGFGGTNVVLVFGSGM
jgi:3-oxoacyl-[acyl-carrier-protein] synthase I